jgi:hypothetical protein
MVNNPPTLPPNQLNCFQDAKRVCGPDCMAFITPPHGDDYRGQQWAQCLLLVNAHRTGKHLVILADSVGRHLQKAGQALADQARANQPAPPTVR